MGSIKEDVLGRGAAIRQIVERNRAYDPRLFGSMARGDDGPESDVDILVEAGPRCSLLDLCQARIEIEDLIGRRVDVRTIGDLHWRMRPSVLEQAVPL